MYLRRWAGDGGVRFTEVATGESDIKDPEAIANDEYFYRIEAPDIDPDEVPDLWFETHMSRIEDAAARWLRALDGSPDGRLTNTNLCENLAVFVALQSQRTPRARAAELDIEAGIARFGARNIIDDRRILPILCQARNIAYRPSLHNQIVNQILSQPLISESAKPKAIESAIGVWRNTIAPHLEGRSWWLVSTPDPLMTSDEPVVLIGPGQPREYRPRFFNSPLVLFPVGPDRLLMLAHSDSRLSQPFTLDTDETRAVNLEIMASCHEYVYEHPASDIAAHISVPDLPAFDPAAAATFWESVMVPTRWQGVTPLPDWPLPRWT